MQDDDWYVANFIKERIHDAPVLSECITSIASDKPDKVRTAQEKPGKRDFLRKVNENLETSENFLTIFTASGKTQGILLCQTSLVK